MQPEFPKNLVMQSPTIYNATQLLTMHRDKLGHLGVVVLDERSEGVRSLGLLAHQDGGECVNLVLQLV